MNPLITPEELKNIVDAHLAERPEEPLHLFDLPETLYRQFPAVNVSALKPLAESPKKYKHALDNPMKQTAAMIFGSCVHAILLTPEELPKMVVTRPAEFDSFRTAAAKAWRDKQTAMAVTAEELQEMHDCANAVKSDPRAAWILSRAQKEVAVFKRHQRTGLLLKARLDLPFEDLEGNTAVCDLKKTTSVKPSLFSKAIGERLYHMQGAFYADIIGASSFYFIAVEEDAPYEVDIFRLKDESLQRGRALYETMLERLAKCQADNRWPGVSEDSDAIREIEEPIWAR